MQIVVTKQIGIEAETIEQALTKVANGEGATISVSASARPQPGGVAQGTGQVGSQFQRTTVKPTP